MKPMAAWLCFTYVLLNHTSMGMGGGEKGREKRKFEQKEMSRQITKSFHVRLHARP